MKESFLDNKNKILNDLKAKKQLNNNNTNPSIEPKSSNISNIMFQAKGDKNVKENDKFYVTIVQNYQIGFDTIKDFPIIRFYDKNVKIKDIIESITQEYGLNNNKYTLNEQNDIYLKSCFDNEKSLAETSNLKNGDTIMFSKL